MKILLYLPLLFFSSALLGQDTLHLTDTLKELVNTQRENQGQVKSTQKFKEIPPERSKPISLKEDSLGQRKGYAVLILEDTLFMIYNKMGPIQAGDRAVLISNRIEEVVELEEYYPDSLVVVSNEETSDLVYGDKILMSISDADARLLEMDRKSSADLYYMTVFEYIKAEREDNSFFNILKRIGLTVLIVMGATFLIRVLNGLTRKLKLWLVNRKDQYFKGLKIRNYEFLTQSRLLDLALRLTTLLKWFVIVIILYVSLPLLFSLFPFTKSWATILISWIWNPASQILSAVADYLPNLFTIGVIFVVFHYIIRFVHFISTEVQSGHLTLPGFHSDWARPTFNIVKFLLYAFMFILIFPYLPGSDSPVFRGVSVFLGILFSLGSSTAIANAISGLVITYMRPFLVGDRVKIGEVTGEVIEKSLLVTRIRTTKNEYITVPNASILTGYTINYSTAREKKEGIIINTTITIGYDVPWRKIHELLINAASETDGINVSNEPFVLQTSLDDFYVSYQINAYSDVPEQMPQVYSRLHENIQDKFNEAGIEILSPGYRAIRDGNQSTVVRDGGTEDERRGTEDEQ